MNHAPLFGRLAFLAVATGLAPTLFGAAITASISPLGPVGVGATVTVTVNLTGYTAADEIDGYEFKVSYPAGLFSFVAGSESLHDAAAFGAAENWLRKAPQDGVGAGAILTDGTTSLAGIVNISVVDLRGASTRGTLALDGFLYSFDLTATGVGAGAITPSLPASGSVFYDVALSPTATTPTFTGVPVTVVPEPALAALLMTGAGMLLIGRMRRR